MKKQTILLVATTLFNIIQSHSGYDRLTIPSQRLVTYVGQSRFLKSGGTSLQETFSINNPGIYVLTEDISSSVGGGEIVYVNSDDVIFDLGGKTIKLSGTNGSNVDAIFIASGVDNVEVRNGTITNMKDNAVNIQSSCTNIRLKDLYLNSCNTSGTANTGGIKLDGGDGSEVESCVIENCHIRKINANNAESGHGIYGNYSKYLTIKDCSIAAVQTTADAFHSYGIYLGNSQYPTILNTKATSTEGDNNSAGMYFLTCTGVTLKNCEASGSSSTDTSAGKGYGFYLEDTNNSTFEDCLASNNSGPVAASGFYSTSCINNRYINCVSRGNIVTDTTSATNATGFETARASSKGATISCIFQNCTAFGQRGTSDIQSTAAGFLLTDARFCIVENCTSFGNDGSSGGYGYGIYLSGSNNQRCVIKGNHVSANTAGTGAFAYGIRDDGTNTPDNVFYENIMMVNSDSSGSPTDSNNFASTQLTIETNFVKALDLDTFTMNAAEHKAWNMDIKAATT